MASPDKTKSSTNSRGALGFEATLWAAAIGAVKIYLLKSGDGATLNT